MVLDACRLAHACLNGNPLHVTTLMELVIVCLDTMDHLVN